jgi:hypothetical protein
MGPKTLYRRFLRTAMCLFAVPAERARGKRAFSVAIRSAFHSEPAIVCTPPFIHTQAGDCLWVRLHTKFCATRRFSWNQTTVGELQITKERPDLWGSSQTDRTCLQGAQGW